ncbi:hypothetical protein C8Q75DRAFT_722116 [Abortiporus biennis]|nr:hypothetical protein C8Q75DRAFT_722116 [Abortiporus biennis]
MATQNGTGRWYNGAGQVVDSNSPEWDLADEIVKLKIADGNAAVLEGSPLESASEASADSASSISKDQSLSFGSHSRGSSADTTGSSHASAASQTLRAAPFTPLKVGSVAESKNRPHSYSGGLSTADLSRLQQAGSPASKGELWTSPNGTPERQSEQPSYPSLASQNSEDVQAEYQRRFSPQGPGPVQYAPNNRPPNLMTNQGFRQPRGFNPQMQLPGVMPSPTNFGYPGPLHPTAMQMNNPQQQLYDMILPTPPLENPAMARLQQQQLNGFRPGHQHSASDPASLRDPATLALINSSMQAFAAGQMYPPAIAPPAALSMFANQFYGAPQDAYPSPELAMMARLQAQYSGPYGVSVAPQSVPLGSNPTNSPDTVTANSTGNGPSANNRKLGLYKTELCRSWEEKGSCRYGTKCQFAHGEDELRKVQRHPKYKTEICRTFWVSGSCPYGKRCCFIHTELPASGAPPGADGAPPPPNPDGRARSASTNSDEVPTSLLARISAKRSQEGTLNSGSGSVSTTPPSAGYAARPGSLRVDTSVIDTANNKQNKSAYPTFTHNGMMMPTSDEGPSMSPGPVTAAPDFGRHASSRMEIVGTQQRPSKTNNSNVRHSYSGSDAQLDLNSATPTGNTSNQFNMSPPEPSRGARINGHVRSGSAGNWGNATRSTAHLTAYPLSSIPGGEIKANSPWADYNANSRVSEKTWV